jgi:hypothetical protein
MRTTVMKRSLFLVVIFLALLLLAVGGWAVQGVRRALPQPA